MKTLPLILAALFLLTPAIQGESLTYSLATGSSVTSGTGVMEPLQGSFTLVLAGVLPDGQARFDVTQFHVWSSSYDISTSGYLWLVPGGGLGVAGGYWPYAGLTLIMDGGNPQHGIILSSGSWTGDLTLPIGFTGLRGSELRIWGAWAHGWTEPWPGGVALQLDASLVPEPCGFVVLAGAVLPLAGLCRRGRSRRV